MKEISFYFPMRAVSFQVQQFHKGKTGLQKGFEKMALFYLRNKEREMREFKESFFPDIHVLESSWAFLYTDFFTKKENTVSARCLDLDNSTKNIQDVIFKHGLEMNDSLIVKQHSFKWKADKDAIILKLKVLERLEIEKELEESLKDLLP